MESDAPQLIGFVSFASSVGAEGVATVDPLALVQEWFAIQNGRELDRMADCMGEVYLRHDAQGNRAVSPDAYTAEVRRLQERVPDGLFEIEDSAVNGDRVWVRFRMTGTNPQTGQPMTRSGLQVYRVQDGKLAETWAAFAPEGHDWSEPVDSP